MPDYSIANLQSRDKQVIWHPYTQMLTASDPVPVVSASGAWLYGPNGEKYLDAISSWWVITHGHAHPVLSEALANQAKQLEQVIFAGFTHPNAVLLAERLLQIAPWAGKVFYSDNGSTAVEVAMKMALQYWSNQKIDKRKIIAIEGAYHGDTFGAMSVSSRSVFTDPFKSMLFDVVHIPFPDKRKEQECIDALKTILIQHHDIAAFIFEPLVQGAAGMRMYEADILNELLSICRTANVLTIADEVMTGFGRTGKMFAVDYVQERPDIMCLSKGITAGYMPFGATLCSDQVYEAFLSEDRHKTLFHGHSYTGNALACALACANLDVFESERTLDKISVINRLHKQFSDTLKNAAIREIRVAGSILAIELITETPGYLSQSAQGISDYFLQYGILLRPLGNVIYLLPPYCIKEEELKIVYAKISEYLNSVSC